MTPSRFPCRLCGQSTDGVDAYVVCADCAAEYERYAGGRPGDDGRWSYPPPTGPAGLPLSAGEVEASLRKLLDDW